MTTLVGLFGHPVRQNLSAIMHGAAFDALGMDWKYVLRDIPPEQIGEAVRRVRDEGWVGWNVTVPDKTAIVPFMNRLSEEARIIGAVNTVQGTPDGLFGHNTDGAGFIMGLQHEAGLKVAGLRMALVGAGGAGRAVAVYAAREGVRQIDLYNTRIERAREVAALVESANPSVTVRAIGPEEVPSAVGQADLVVNATPVGMWPRVDAEPPIDPAWLAPHSFVCDIINNPPRTRLLEAATERGCKTINGLPMLAYQGALAFELWTGREAPVDVMRRAAEKAVANWR